MFASYSGIGTTGKQIWSAHIWNYRCRHNPNRAVLRKLFACANDQSFVSQFLCCSDGVDQCHLRIMRASASQAFPELPQAHREGIHVRLEMVSGIPHYKSRRLAFVAFSVSPEQSLQDKL